MADDSKNAWLRGYKRRLQQLREDHGVSRADMAKLLGVTKSAFDKYENRGTSALPIHQIPTVCRRFGCSSWYLLTGKMNEEHLERPRQLPQAEERPFRRSR